MTLTDLFTHLKGFKSLEKLDLSGWEVTEDLKTGTNSFQPNAEIILDVAIDSE